jgi:hypothetical protein
VFIVCELLKRGHLKPGDLALYLVQLRFYTFLCWCYLGALHRHRTSQCAQKLGVPNPYDSNQPEGEECDDETEDEDEDAMEQVAQDQPKC